MHSFLVSVIEFGLSVQRWRRLVNPTTLLSSRRHFFGLKDPLLLALFSLHNTRYTQLT
jgi:hypothetical protein